MDNKAFIKEINKFYSGKTMQVIPAYSFKKMPPYPFSTYQTKSKETDLINIDGRTERNDKLIEIAAVRTEEELIFKCYGGTEIEAESTCKDLQDTIRFKLDDIVSYKNYGIISVGDVAQYHEQTNGGYIYCYGFSIVIDYNHNIEREIDILETIELTDDINAIIKVKEVNE